MVTGKYRRFGNKATTFVFLTILEQDLAWNTYCQLVQTMQGKSLGHCHVHPASQ
jgi:hypothetical protein